MTKDPNEAWANAVANAIGAPRPKKYLMTPEAHYEESERLLGVMADPQQVAGMSVDEVLVTVVAATAHATLALGRPGRDRESVVTV